MKPEMVTRYARVLELFANEHYRDRALRYLIGCGIDKSHFIKEYEIHNGKYPDEHETLKVKDK